jgi:hypothetical protein
MRRPCADREEKRATREERDGKTRKEQLDLNNPNQRRLSEVPALSDSNSAANGLFRCIAM